MRTMFDEIVHVQVFGYLGRLGGLLPEVLARLVVDLSGCLVVVDGEVEGTDSAAAADIARGGKFIAIGQTDLYPVPFVRKQYRLHFNTAKSSRSTTKMRVSVIQRSRARKLA